VSDTELENKEQDAVLDDTAADFSPEEQSEFNNLNDDSSETPADQVGKGFTGGGKPKKKFWSRRKKVGGGVVGVALAAAFGASVIIGPGFAVNHLREIIMNRVSQVQVDHSRRYRRARISKVVDLFSKDGRLGGKVIADMEAKGYSFKFDPSNKNQVVGLVTPNGNSLIGDGIGDHIDDYMEVRHPLRTARWKTKRTEALYRRYGVSRKSIVAKSDESIKDPDKEINKRIAQNTLDDPVELDSAADKIPEDETDAEKAAREARENSVNEASKTSGAIGEIRDDLLDGEDLDDAARKAGVEAGGEAVEQLGTGAGEAVLKTAAAVVSGASVGSRIFSGFKSFLSPTDVLDKVCTIKNRLRMSVMISRNYRALTLIKYASTFIGVGDGVRRGDVDAKLLNSVMKRVTSEDRNGNSIGASPGFAYALKGKFSKAKNDSSKGKYAVDGQLSGTWKGVQDSTDNIPGTSKSQCGTIQNPLFQVGSAVVITGGKALLCTVTLGAGCAATQAGEEAAKVAATQAIKTAIQNSIRQIFTRQTIKALAITAATELSFEGIMALTQLHIEKNLALPTTGQEEGAELGSILVAGGGAANKQRSLQAGMVPATVAEYAQAENEYIARKNENLKSQSLWARLTDTSNPDSLEFQLAMSIPMGASSLISEGTNLVSTNISSALSGNFLSSTFSKFFSNKAHAEDEISYDEYQLEAGTYKGEKLAVDFAGNPQVILRSDIAAIDPEENIEFLTNNGDIDGTTLEPKSTQFRDHIANCVDTIDVISRIEFENTPTPEKDCLARNQLTVRFKAHLAFLDMIDGLEAEFIPEDISSGSTTSNTAPIDSTTAIKGNTANVPCSAGTIDVGEADGYSAGQKYLIRLCEIPGFTSASTEDINGLVRVNSTASGKWLQVFNQAKAAGINLTATSSFRTMSKQISLYGCYKSGDCHGGNEAAKPGYSNHQIGFAIDIDINTAGKDPSLTTCKANPGAYPTYSWLATNAPAQGIDAKVVSECWHWSVGGN
jgi:hypothetical protein